MSEDTLVIDLVCQWEDRRAKGESITLEDLCRDSPNLLEHVRAAIAKIEAADGLLSPTVVEPRASESVDSTLPGIPGYEVLDVLGCGGMGIVYKARQVGVNRLVALKMIRSGNLSVAEEKARFQVEAEAIAALKHPNVVQLHEFGTYQNLPYFTLEFVEGGSLAARIKKQALPLNDSVALVMTLARAVAVAHASGIVHRDLKPENILLAADGSPKITDFGLAKSFGRSSSNEDTTDALSPAPWGGVADAGLTRTGAIMGTPSYMAPEQARGEKIVGPGADIWALGAIFYRLLTGRPPFVGSTPIEIVRQVIDSAPASPRALNRSLPRDLETICLKCLRKEPEQRYDSAQALADDLQCYVDSKPIHARPVGSIEKSVKWVKRNPLETVFIAVILALLLGGSALVYAKYLDEKEQARIAQINENEAKKQEGIARSREAEALALARIAKSNADEAAKQESIAKDRADDLAREVRRARRQRDNAAVMLAQNDFANDNVLVARERLDEIAPENRGWEWHYLKRQFEGSLFALYGHEDNVSSAAISADGDRIVTGSYDKAARIWDGRTGECLLQLKGHTEGITDVALSIDGDRVATMSTENVVRIWNAHTGDCTVEFKAGDKVKQFFSTARGLAMSADGSRIVTTTAPKIAHLWDANTGRRLFELQGHTDFVGSVAISADGGRIITGSHDKTVRLWDGRTGELLRTFKGHDSSVQNVAMSADASRIVAGWYDKTATIWNSTTGQVVCELTGHADSVNGVAMSADGSRVVTAGYSITSTFKNPQVWDARTGQSLMDLKGHTESVFGVAISADGSRVVTLSRYEAPRVWNARAVQRLLEFRSAQQFRGVAINADASRIVTQDISRHTTVRDGRSGRLLFVLIGFLDGIADQVAISADGDRVVVGSISKPPTVFNGRTGRLMHALESGADRATSLAISADGRRIVTGYARGITRIWDTETGKVLHESDGNVTDVTGAAMSADGKRIVTCSFQTTLVRDGETGQVVRRLAEGARCVAITPDGNLIVTGTDRTARIWDGRTGQPLLELRGHAESIWSVAISPDGNRVVTASWDKTARIWDGVTGQTLAELKGHTKHVQQAAFSSDGSTIVTASWDGTARVWDGRIEARSFAFVGHTGAIYCMVHSHDGERIVTGSADTTARVWDGRTGKSLAELKGHTGSIGCAAMSADGNRVVTGSADRTARVWNARTGECLFELIGHTWTVRCVAISNDGSLVVTGSEDRTVRIWSGEDGKCLFELKGHKGEVRKVSLSPDARRVYSRDSTNTPMVWDALNGEALKNAPFPHTPELPRYFSDGERLLLVSGRRVLNIPLQIDDNERQHRLWSTRPEMSWYVRRQKELAAEKNASVALYRALEMRSRGYFALEIGRMFDGFLGLTVAKGMLLRVPVTAEVAPAPREAPFKN